MGTVIVSVILICIVGWIIRTIRKDKKNGRSPICGCNCKDCSGHCGK